jgi:molecular chaperone DnaJ
VRSRAPGDLLCRVVVETPVNLTSEQRRILAEFEETFEGEDGQRHSPRTSSFLDGVKAFWDRVTS